MMDIYAKEGTKVVYNSPNAGMPIDQEMAKRHSLVKGEIYTVDHTVVYDWNTQVGLKEIPGVRFNSVLFDEVDT